MEDDTKTETTENDIETTVISAEKLTEFMFRKDGFLCTPTEYILEKKQTKRIAILNLLNNLYQEHNEKLYMHMNKNKSKDIHIINILYKLFSSSDFLDKRYIDLIIELYVIENEIIYISNKIVSEIKYKNI